MNTKKIQLKLKEQVNYLYTELITIENQYHSLFEELNYLESK